MFWNIGEKRGGDLEGATGSIDDIFGLVDSDYQNASPLWSAKSIVFYKQTETFQSQNLPTRASAYYSAWVVNMETGESTGFYLGAPQILNITTDGHSFPLPGDDRDILKELRDWFRSMQRVTNTK